MRHPTNATVTRFGGRTLTRVVPWDPNWTEVPLVYTTVSRQVHGRRTLHSHLLVGFGFADKREASPPYGKRALRTLEPGRIQCDTRAPGLRYTRAGFNFL